MPDIWMDVDAALAEVPVNIFPLTDDTDFKAIEGAVAYNAAGMALFWHFTTCAGAYTVTAVTPTTGGNYDWTDQGDSGIYTIGIPASGGASINNDTEGFGWFTGSATGILPWRGPVIGFRRAALNDLLIEGGTASTNLEDFFDGTGYAGGTAKLDVNVATIAANAITATAINADAITSAKIADDAIAAEHLATGAFTADAFAANAIVAATLATGVITNAKFAAGAIDAAAIANGAIDAATFAADADAEIAAMVWNAATASYGGAGTYGQAVEDTLADTNELQGDWVNGGRLDLLLDALPTAASIADAVWDEASTGHTDAGKAGAQVWTDIDAILADTGTDGVVLANDAITAAKIADNAIAAEHLAAGAIDFATFAADCKTGTGLKANVESISADAITATAIQNDAITAAKIANGAIDAATFAADVDAEAAGWIWNAAMASFGGAGTYGQALEDTIEDTGTTLPGTLAAIAGYIDTEVASILAAVDTEVAAILADTNELQADWANGGRLDLIVDAIKAKTDSLTFTVAGLVDGNIQRVNDVELQGDGSTTPWGPAE